MKRLSNIYEDETGQGMVEYGLIIGLTTITIIVAFSLFSTQISELYNRLLVTITAAA